MFHDVWRGRQLQHGRVLSRAQASHQNDLPIGKLQRIMMRTGTLRIDLTEPKLESGVRCYTQTGHGLGETGCEVPVEANRDPASDDTFVRMFSAPTEDSGIPNHAIIRKDSKVEFISASVRFVFNDSGESIDLGVRDDVWLKVRIDGNVGWIHTQEDLAAIGLPQAG